MKKRALVVLACIILMGMATTYALISRKHTPMQIPVGRSDLAVQLVAADTTCYAVVQTSRPEGLLVRLHAEDFSFELKGSDGVIVLRSPGYKRPPPGEKDWFRLKPGEKRTVFLFPDQDYANSHVNQSSYRLTVILVPADAKSAPRRAGNSSPVWKGPAVTSNTIGVRLNHQTFSYEE